jgi:hypothetical protein
MFQTRYILDFLSASRQAVVVEHWDFPNTEISSLMMSLQLNIYVGNFRLNDHIKCLFPILICINYIKLISGRKNTGLIRLANYKQYLQ